jgi:WD40 repeat protein
MEHLPGASSLVISSDSKTLISGSFGQLTNKDTAINTIKIWELSTGKLIRDFRENSHSVNHLVLTPDGKIMISSNFDGTIKFWNWRKGELISTLNTNSNPVLVSTISPDGRLLASSSEDGTIRIWKLF